MAINDCWLDCSCRASSFISRSSSTRTSLSVLACCSTCSFLRLQPCVQAAVLRVQLRSLPPHLVQRLFPRLQLIVHPRQLRLGIGRALLRIEQVPPLHNTGDNPADQPGKGHGGQNDYPEKQGIKHAMPPDMKQKMNKSKAYAQG